MRKTISFLHLFVHSIEFELNCLVVANYSNFIIISSHFIVIICEQQLRDIHHLLISLVMVGCETKASLLKLIDKLYLEFQQMVYLSNPIQPSTLSVLS